MRNLKRVLSLALALVMVLGMMVITTSAADFTDAEEITYQEAVDVVSAIGVINGYEAADGTFSFNPKGILTREEGAALICYLLMGKENADKLVGSGVFSDVAATRWSAGEIDYCANLGILDGMGDGTFAPKGELKAVQFGKMLLCALGYDAKIEGYTGKNWATSIATDMIEIGLDLYGVAMDQPLTREAAAEMILLALECNTVEYDDKGSSITVGGVEIATGASEAKASTDVNTTWDAVTSTWVEVDYTGTVDGKLQFCEKYFADLYLVNGSTDDFNRPGHSWYYGSMAPKHMVGQYNNPVTETVLVTGVKNDTLAEIADELELDDSTYLGLNTSFVKGEVVEVYANYLGKIYDVVVLEQKLAKVTKVTPVTDKDAKYSYTVALTGEGGVENYKDTALIGFDAETMVKDTYVTVIAGTNTAIVAVAEPTTGLMTAKGDGYVKIDGAEFEFSGNQWGTTDGTYETDDTALNFTSTYDVYTDANGYIVGIVEAAAVKVPTTVFFVSESKIADMGTFAGGETAKLAVTYLDGTTGVVDMEISKAGKISIGASEVKVADYTALSMYSLTPGFYQFVENEDGTIKAITAVDYNTANPAVKGFAYLYNGMTVSFTESKAKVQWWGTPFYANADTTLTTIKAGVPTSVITGYENFPSKTFTASNTVGSEVYALVEFDKDVVKAVYVIGDTATAVADDAVYGWYVKTGDTYMKGIKTYTDVVYNVAGVDTTYTIEASSVASTYKKLVSIVVSNGVATLTQEATNANKVFDKVTDTYVVVNGDSDATYLAQSVAVYDVTNVNKNGVVALNEIPTDAVVTYVTNAQSKITAVYVTYAAQEDGVLAKNDATYIETVLGFGAADAAAAAAQNSGYVVMQYTRPAQTTKNELTVKDSTGAVVYHEYNTNTTAGTKGFMIDPAGWNVGDTTVDTTNVGGALALADGTYTFTIECNDVVVCAGSFVVG